MTPWTVRLDRDAGVRIDPTYPSFLDRAVKDEHFKVRFFPSMGLGDGFEIPHPYREGAITITTTPFSAAALGATTKDVLWHIFIAFTPGGAGTVKAEIVDSGSPPDATDADSAMKNIGEYNAKNRTFQQEYKSAEVSKLSCAHVCREQDFLVIRMSTAWHELKTREITLDSDGRLVD